MEIFQEATLSRSYSRVLHTSPLPSAFVSDRRTCHQPLGHLLISRSADQSKFVPTTRERSGRNELRSLSPSATLVPSPSSPLSLGLAPPRSSFPPRPLRLPSNSVSESPGISLESCRESVHGPRVFPSYSRIHSTEPTPTIFGVR